MYLYTLTNFLYEISSIFELDFDFDYTKSPVSTGLFYLNIFSYSLSLVTSTIL